MPVDAPTPSKPRKRMPYAHVCVACEHYSSVHLLAPYGDLRAGPYRCEECDCEIPQDGPFYGLTKRQYEEREALSGE